MSARLERSIQYSMHDQGPQFSYPRRGFFQRLQDAAFVIGRRSLTWWVSSPAIVGEEHLTDLQDKTVCYVMPQAARLELMLLEQNAMDTGRPRPCMGIHTEQLNEPYAFAVLMHADSMLRSKRRIESRDAERLQRLQRKLEQHPELDVLLLPVVVYWGRAPYQKATFWSLVFFKYWLATGWLQRLRTVLFSRRHITIQYSRAVSMRDILGDSRDSSRTTRKLYRLLRVHFRRQRFAILGPDLSHRRTMIQRIMDAENIRNLIQKTANEDQKETRLLKQKAHDYAFEIVSNMSYATILFGDYFFSWVWNKIYHGIKVHNIDAVKAIAETHTLVYLPCHRSYMDFILLSYVLFHNGLTIPHIASGNNLNLPIVGTFFRHCGAFFMRRSFSNALYAAVFQEYMHLILANGHSMEFFIEGTRTRTGRTLAPKRGMLSMMLRSYLRSIDKPIALVPLYFGYEKVMESSAYLKENKGNKKQKESLAGLLSAMRQRLRLNYGEVHVNFSEPIELDKFLDRQQPGWRSSKDRQQQTAWLSYTSNQLSRAITTNINKAVTVLPINLLACCLLAAPDNIISQERLKQQLQLLVHLLTQVPVCDSLVVAERSAENIIERAKSMDILVARKQADSDHLAYKKIMTRTLAWYQNNILHAIILPALVAAVWYRMPGPNRHSVSSFCKTLYPYLQQEYHLPWSLEEIDRPLDQCHVALVKAGMLKPSAGHDYAFNHGSQAALHIVKLLASIADAVLSHYFVVLFVIQHESENMSDLSALAARSIDLAQQTNPSLATFELTDHGLISQFAKQLVQSDLIQISGSGAVQQDAAVTKLIKASAWWLAPELQAAIMQQR